MKTTVYQSDFDQAFRDMDRGNNFSREGLMLLWNYLEEYEESTGVEIELDVVALCCDFSEDHWEDVAYNYGIDLADCEDDDEKIEAVRDYLEYHTSLVGYAEGEQAFIYQVF